MTKRTPLELADEAMDVIESTTCEEQRRLLLEQWFMKLEKDGPQAEASANCKPTTEAA